MSHLRRIAKSYLPATAALLLLGGAFGSACSSGVGPDDPDELNTGKGGSSGKSPAGGGGKNSVPGAGGTGELGGAGAPAGNAGSSGRADGGTSTGQGGSSLPAPDGGLPPVDPAAPYKPGRAAISEIMYHPVDEDSIEDEYEFVEIANLTDTALSLAGWKLDGTVKMTFAAGAMLPPKGYGIVARNSKKVAELYKLGPEKILGDYMSALDNGGGTVSLRDDKDMLVEQVRYKDNFPWPLLADAFGASEKFFPSNDPRLPFTKHKNKGYSLERISFQVSPGAVVNWLPSKLDAATPGAANSALGTPLPIVEDFKPAPEAEPTRAIAKADKVKVSVKFSNLGTVKDPKLEWFVDDFRRKDEPKMLVPLTESQGIYSAVLPAQADRSVVRFRIRGDRGMGDEIISPRPGEPLIWHAYYVTPTVAGKTEIYEIFIDPKDWGDLWTWIQGGRAKPNAMGPYCMVNPNWETTKTATFVHKGQVHDVLVRYQGSGENRWNGVPFKKAFDGVGPIGGPMPMQALSWEIKFPGYDRMEGRSTLILNKLTQACPGALTTSVGTEMMKVANTAVQKIFRFARVYINGGYYHYMTDREHTDDAWILRNFPNDPIGDMFKNVGFYKRDDGLWGIGDMRKLSPLCGFTADQRYDATYERKTWEWKKGGSGEIKTLIEEFHKARDTDLPTGKWDNVRKFFTDRFDLDHALTYRAIANWIVHFDDVYHNHFFYKRATDGKWIQFPYDFDYIFGGWTSTGRSDQSFYLDTQEAHGIADWWNYFTDALLLAFRAEYNAKLKELSMPGKILDPDVIAKIVDNGVATAGYVQDEARAAPGGTGCTTDYKAQGETMKTWAKARNAFLKKTIP